MNFLSSLKNKSLSNEICLLRTDFNIKKINDNLRFVAILPTIEFLINKGAKVVILSHYGRPKKEEIRKKKEKNFSLRFTIDFLNKKLKKKISFLNFNNFENSNIIKFKNKIKKMPAGSIFLLENLRFLPGEEKNEIKLAKNLAALGTLYINDAFSVCHRQNASVVNITKFIPSYAGLLLEKEIKNLDKIYKLTRKGGLVIILGGIKISDKIGLIKNFKNKADYFLIGGGMANTMFVAQGLPIGNSFYESKMILFAKQLLKSNSGKIILPIDTVINNHNILDIGPQTIKKYSEIIKKAKTIIWNGPMGYIEDMKFLNGSKEIIKAITKSRAFSVIGGGETASVALKVKSQISKNVFISTGGGAMIEYLTNKKLPGIEALKRKTQNVYL